MKEKTAFSTQNEFIEQTISALKEISENFKTKGFDEPNVDQLLQVASICLINIIFLRDGKLDTVKALEEVTLKIKYYMGLYFREQLELMGFGDTVGIAEPPGEYKVLSQKVFSMMR